MKAGLSVRKNQSITLLSQPESDFLSPAEMDVLASLIANHIYHSLSSPSTPGEPLESAGIVQSSRKEK